ncbi:unnamed protein product, partial [Prorocentrum cordatum]
RRGGQASKSLRQGQQVVVLRQGGGPPQAHAGEVGALTKLGADKAKHEVTISGDAASGHEPTVVKVKGADSVAPPMAPPNAALAVGTLAVLRGLRGHAELNGCLVRVVECEEGGRRFAVQSSEEGQTLRVKKENLLAVEAQGLRLPLRDLVVAAAPPCARAPKAEAPAALEGEALLGKDSIRQGEVVKLHGLKTAQQYNGQTGTVLKVDRARNRYEVQLQDGSDERHQSQPRRGHRGQRGGAVPLGLRCRFRQDGLVLVSGVSLVMCAGALFLCLCPRAAAQSPRLRSGFVRVQLLGRDNADSALAYPSSKTSLD